MLLLLPSSSSSAEDHVMCSASLKRYISKDVEPGQLGLAAWHVYIVCTPIDDDWM